MELMDVGEPIATRSLDLANRGPVTVTIGMPKQFLDSTDFYCPYQITGLAKERIGYAGGVDAVQALMLTLERIGAELCTLEEVKSGELSWQGDEAGALGFPVPGSIKDLLPKAR